MTSDFKNEVAINSDGNIMCISDGKNWVRIKSPKIKKPIAFATAFKSWQITL